MAQEQRANKGQKLHYNCRLHEKHITAESDGPFPSGALIGSFVLFF